MTDAILMEDRYNVLWDGCDVAIETVMVFYVDMVPETDKDWKSLELTVEDRFCVEDLARFSAVHYRLSWTV